MTKPALAGGSSGWSELDAEEGIDGLSHEHQAVLYVDSLATLLSARPASTT